MAAANRVRRLNILTLEPTFPFWPSNPEIVVHRRIPIWGALRFTCRAQADFASRRSSTQWGGGHYLCFTSERWQRGVRARKTLSRGRIYHTGYRTGARTRWHVGAGMRRDEGIQVPTRSFR
jgi:hypothetical protein